MRKRSLRLYGFRNARAAAIIAGDGIEKKELYIIYVPEVSSLMIRRTVYIRKATEIFLSCICYIHSYIGIGFSLN